jgi:hypothetical protein
MNKRTPLSFKIHIIIHSSLRGALLRTQSLGMYKGDVGPAPPVVPDPFAAPGHALESFEEKAHQAAATAETMVQTRARWAEWCSYALSSASIFTSVACDSGSDGDNEPPQRHPLEVAVTERFLAADLRRRVRMAQTEMPPLTIKEKLALPAWMSWGRGSAPHGAAATGGDEGPATRPAWPRRCARCTAATLPPRPRTTLQAPGGV